VWHKQCPLFLKNVQIGRRVIFTIMLMIWNGILLWMLALVVQPFQWLWLQWIESGFEICIVNTHALQDTWVTTDNEKGSYKGEHIHLLYEVTTTVRRTYLCSIWCSIDANLLLNLTCSMITTLKVLLVLSKYFIDNLTPLLID